MVTSSWKVERGLEYLRRARQDATSGRFAVAAADERAESYLRRALRSYWSAMNWMEDTPEFEAAHAEMHEVGRLARESFPDGCRPERTEAGGYVQRCPVFLSHKRFGLSIGAMGNAICSICGDDASDCPHIPGRTYEVQASRVAGRCTICGEDKCGQHEVGVIYDAEARVLVTEMDLREVTIVRRPAMPDARIMEVTITPEEVEREFGRLPAGARIKCDKCLHPCEGFDHLPERSATDVGPRTTEAGDVLGMPGA